MNKRIKELAIEAGMIVGEANGFDMTRLMPREVKFAELIVKECAEFSFKYAGDLKAIQDCKEVDLNLSLSDIRNATKKHFGVEE